MIDVVFQPVRHYDIHSMETDIEKSTLRKKILGACIERQRSLISDVNARIEAIMETPGLGNEEEYDNSVLSTLTQQAEEIDALREVTRLATDEMTELSRLALTPETNHNIVEPGAIVVTNKNTFYISVSIEQFEVDGESYIGISTNSPLYQAMKGLTKDEIFHCKGIVYKILDVL